MNPMIGGDYVQWDHLPLNRTAFHKDDIAFVTRIGDDYMHSVDVLMEAIDSVKSYYYDDPDHFGYAWMGTDENLKQDQEIISLPKSC